MSQADSRRSARLTPRTLSTLIVALLAAIALVFGVVLAFIGLPFWVGVSDGGGEPYRFAQTSGMGYVFAFGGAIVLIGLMRDSRALCWLGAVIIAGFAGIGLFGVGAVMIPVGLLLMLALLVREFVHR